MNRFSKDGTQASESDRLMLHAQATTVRSNAQEDIQERLLTEKAADLMTKLKKVIEKKKDKKRLKK